MIYGFYIISMLVTVLHSYTMTYPINYYSWVHWIVILSASDIGDVYAWGWNESGQVGIRCNKRKSGEMKYDRSGCGVVMVPTLLFDDDTDIVVADLSCGSRHSAAVTGTDY